MDLDNKTNYKVNIFVFFAVIFAGAALFFVLPKNEISENEKRTLTKFPTFSVEHLFTGAYTDSIDLYYADNFTFRNNLLGFAASMKENYGMHNSEVSVYHANGKLPEVGDEILLDGDIGDEHLNDSLSPQDTSAIQDTIVDEPSFIVDGTGKVKQYDGSIYVFKDKAFQLYGGNTKAMGRYADLMNLYHDILQPETKVFCLAIPKLSKYFLPEKYWANNRTEKSNIDHLYASLNPAVKGIKAYQKHQQHFGEYLYFNTDHHWTGLGAYYAYQAFCEEAGFSYYQLSDFETKKIKPFLGTLYHLTLSPELKRNPDSVMWYKLPVTTTSRIVKTGNDVSKGTKWQMLYRGTRGANSYGVFLGGDNPLMKIETSVKNDLKVLVIKDSNGNAFTPFLSLHFSEVFVADYRYYKANIVDLIKENKITHVIFAHSSLVCNRGYTIQRERSMLGKYRYEVKKDTLNIEVDSIKIDSSSH